MSLAWHNDRIQPGSVKREQHLSTSTSTGLYTHTLFFIAIHLHNIFFRAVSFVRNTFTENMNVTQKKKQHNFFWMRPKEVRSFIFYANSEQKHQPIRCRLWRYAAPQRGGSVVGSKATHFITPCKFDKDSAHTPPLLTYDKGKQYFWSNYFALDNLCCLRNNFMCLNRLHKLDLLIREL